MTCVLLAQRDAEHYAPKLRSRFPSLDVLTAPDLPEADHRIPEAEVIIANGHPFNEDRLRRAVRLRWIQAMTTGTDTIIGAPTLRPEVIVTTTRGIHAPQMAEMAFLYMLNLARRYPVMRDNQKQHIWKRWTQVRLYGKTVAILGLGLTAEALAPRCKAFGMTVLGITRRPRPFEGCDHLYDYPRLKEAVALADFLVVLAPHSPETDQLVDASVIAAMKPGAFLLNLARGRLLDEDALIGALRSGHLGGAGLDVFRTEPLPPESPLWDMDNVIITAHASGSSDDNLRLTWPILETNMACYLEGRFGDMINIVEH